MRFASAVDRGACCLAGLLLLSLFFFAAKCAHAGEPDAQVFKFDWPVPCRIGVKEKAEQKDIRTEMHYDMVVSRAEDGKKIEVRFENFKILTYNGRDVSGPDEQKEIAPLLALAGAQPTLLISADGAYEDAVGIEEAIKKTLAYTKAEVGQILDAKVLKGLEAMLQSPQMIAQMKTKAGEHWNVWVGLWVGKKLAPHVDLTLQGELTMQGGGTVQVPTTLTHHGQAKDLPSHIHLSSREVMEGKEAKEAMERMLRDIAQKAGNPSPAGDLFESVRREFRGSVVTDPATMRPVQASSETVIEIKGKDGKGKTEREARAYVFEWPTASPAAPAAPTP